MLNLLSGDFLKKICHRKMYGLIPIPEIIISVLKKFLLFMFHLWMVLNAIPVISNWITFCNNSTTAAHEYGHTIGLDHPEILDIRGMGQPGIMYPRGTICDPVFQYDPAAEPLKPGGTINPYTRKVLQSDIDQLRLHKLNWNDRDLPFLEIFPASITGKNSLNLRSDLHR